MGDLDYGADYGLVGGCGTASLSLHSREVAEADRKRWSWEDKAREERRIPLGFVGPAPKAKSSRKRGKR